MIVGIAGAGAVGGHYGLALLRSGLEVRFLSRGAHLKAMQTQGLSHISAGKKEHFFVDCSDDPCILQDCSVILFACKTTQLESMIELTRAYLLKQVLVTMQNGVQAPDLLKMHLPDFAILAASAFIGVCIEPAGTIVHSAAGHVRLGLWTDSQASRRSLAELVNHWRKAGVDAAPVDDMRHMLWQKMVWNCGFNAITALTLSYARDIAIDTGISHWAQRAMAEVIMIAQHEGVKLDQGCIEKNMRVTIQAGPVKSSMWQDVVHQRPVEIEAMNGHIVHLAEKYGVDVPVNRMLYDLMRLRM